MSFFVCLVLLHQTHTHAHTHWVNPWHSRVNQKVGVCVLSGRPVAVFLSLWSCLHPSICHYKRQKYMHENWDRISLALSHISLLHSNTSLSLRPPLLPCWEDDTGQQMKSRRPSTVHYRSLAKNETWALQLLLPPLWAALLCSTVCGFCPSLSHAIKNNGWSLGKLIKLRYKHECRCSSIKCSDVCRPTHVQALCSEPAAEPQMDDDIWEPCTLDPPEKLSTPPPMLPPGYITARIIPCLTDQP